MDKKKKKNTTHLYPVYRKPTLNIKKEMLSKWKDVRCSMASAAGETVRHAGATELHTASHIVLRWKLLRE